MTSFWFFLVQRYPPSSLPVSFPLHQSPNILLKVFVGAARHSPYNPLGLEYLPTLMVDVYGKCREKNTYMDFS